MHSEPTTGGGGGPNFDRAPILLFWETTRACDLACRHCRAEAIPDPLPGELSPEEGRRLIDELPRFGPRPPVLIFTGGDPFRRRDLFDLAERARSLRVPIGFAPSVTPLLTPDAVDRMKALGAKMVSISLDGARPATHEDIRGVPGHFQQTIDAVRLLVDRGVPVQINTTVMRRNAEELADVAGIVGSLGAHVWEVFFLVQVGRGTELEELSPAENEDVSHLLFDASRYGFIVRTVEGPFFRRVVAWRREAGADADVEALFTVGPLYRRLRDRLRLVLGEPAGPPRAQSVGTRDGKGVLFVSYNGDVYPSGFLPLRVGSVKAESIVEIYRSNPVLRAIRGARFTGRCGACEFREACGGSRARAHAAWGDVLAEDPACAYEPAAARTAGA